MRYTPLRFANRENVGRVDHPEHHAQARPKWNGGYKFIVRLGATANKKEIAHNRALLPSEYQRVYMYIADWNRVVGL
jgi:hypothetical protein